MKESNKMAIMGRDAKANAKAYKMTPKATQFSRQRPTSTVEITELPKSDDEAGKPKTTVYTQRAYVREPNAEIDRKTRYAKTAKDASNRKRNVATIEAKNRTSDDSSDEEIIINANANNKNGGGKKNARRINLIECNDHQENTPKQVREAKWRLKHFKMDENVKSKW